METSQMEDGEISQDPDSVEPDNIVKRYVKEKSQTKNGRQKKKGKRKGSQLSQEERVHRKLLARQDKRTRTTFKHVKAVCIYFTQGRCRNGDDCEFLHEFEGRQDKSDTLCKYYLANLCTRPFCVYSHQPSRFPCRYWFTGGTCPNVAGGPGKAPGAVGCEFSHNDEALSTEMAKTKFVEYHKEWLCLPRDQGGPRPQTDPPWWKETLVSLTCQPADVLDFGSGSSSQIQNAQLSPTPKIVNEKDILKKEHVKNFQAEFQKEQSQKLLDQLSGLSEWFFEKVE
eukprot:Filipodium_phascolosomae@DN757_c0_g1_i1.p1